MKNIPHSRLRSVYRYTVMPFSLKNKGAMHQRAMMKIFQDMQYK